MLKGRGVRSIQTFSDAANALWTLPFFKSMMLPSSFHYSQNLISFDAEV